MSAAPTPTAAENPLVEFVRTQRANAAYLLLGLAAAFLVATLWLATKAEKAVTAATPAPAVNPLDPEAPPPPAPEGVNPLKSDYRWGWILNGAATLVCLAGGIVLLVGVPRPTEAARRTHARQLILTVGASLGALLIVGGGIYFLLWNESLTKWLDQNQVKEAKWIVIPLMMVVVGAGLVFLAIQPARADERNNQNLRRLVYGSNLGLTVLLLGVALVVANVVISRKVDNKLDATSTGFYTLSDSTKGLLARLGEPVTAYAVLLDDDTREGNDIRQLLFSAQDAAAPGKFTPKFVSPVSNREEIKKLQDKYPKLSKGATGVLLVIGEEGGRHSFIGAEDLFKVEQSFRPGERGKESFIGEGAILRELNFLDQNEQKAIVYFTQSNGELALSTAGGLAALGGAGREATQVKAFLERNYLDVRPLELAGPTPKVPDDAAVVVVAEPQTPFTDAAAKAVKDYVTGPKKGKLIVAAGTGGLSALRDKKLAKTGLEGLLGEMGVKLGDQFVYSQPTREIDPLQAIAAFTRDGESNPIVATIGPRMPLLSMLLPREVSPAVTQGGPFQVTPILVTHPSRYTWVEDERAEDPYQTAEDLVDPRNAPLRARKQITKAPRSVAVVVAESGAPGPHGMPGAPGVGRAVVYGNGWIFSNEYAAQMGGRGGATPPTFDLLSVSIDWLRDRPPITIPGKEYETYTFPQSEAVSSTRLLYLPLGLAVIVVAGLGAGVWVMRRK